MTPKQYAVVLHEPDGNPWHTKFYDTLAQAREYGESIMASTYFRAYTIYKLHDTVSKEGDK